VIVRATATAEVDDGLDRRRLAVVLSFATSLRWPVTATLLVIAVMLWRFVPGWVAISWLVTGIAVRELRANRLHALAADDTLPIKDKLRRVMWWDVPLGLSHGSAALFMAVMDPTFDALLTMILVSLAAGAVSTSAVVLRLYMIYAGCVFIPTATMWLLAGTPLSVSVALLILMFAAVQFKFANQNAQVFEESYRIRVENEELVRQLAEARDVAEAANRAKSRFLAVASHDLRQPLHALTLHSGLLAQDPHAAEAPLIAREISSAIRSLGQLLDSLLDISKLDAGVVVAERRPIQLKRLITNLVHTHRPQAVEKGLELRFECPADAVVTTDPMLIERLLRNLIDNALKYTERGEVCVLAEAEGPSFKVSVRDTGRGIPVEVQGRVFEEFYQVDNAGRDRASGLGLGLAIVARLAVLLGLPVTLESEPGRGTTVSLMMPRALTVADEEPVDILPDTGLQGVKVLFIDDEEPVRRAMRHVLRRFGCDAVEAASSDEALERTRGFVPELVLADCRLGDGDNGIVAVARLRERWPALPALLISGDTDAERLLEAERSGLPLLHKPVTLERLRAAMSSALGQPAGFRSPADAAEPTGPAPPSPPCAR